MPNNALDKASARRQIHAARRALSVAERHIKSQAICLRAIALAHYNANPIVAGYYPVNTEVDSRPILTHALQHNKKVYLPIMTGDPNKTLLFSPYLSDTINHLHKNTVGVPEPPFDARFALASKNLALVFVPLMAFTSAGYRLGTGGGYYDICFQWLKEARTRKQATCVLVGLGFDCQEIPTLVIDAWDIPLNYIVTESRTLQCL